MQTFLRFIFVYVLFGCGQIEPHGAPQHSDFTHMSLNFADSGLRLQASGEIFLKLKFCQGSCYRELESEFESSHLVIDRLRVGAQTLFAEFVGRDGMLLGASQLQLDLQPGVENSASDVGIQIAKEYSLVMEVAVRQDGEPPVTYKEIAPILAVPEYDCLYCHTKDDDGDPPFLDKFPFSWPNSGLDQRVIAERLLLSIKKPKGAKGRMPSGMKRPSVSSKHVAMIKNWLEDGLLVEPMQCASVDEMITSVACDFEENERHYKETQMKKIGEGRYALNYRSMVKRPKVKGVCRFASHEGVMMEKPFSRSSRLGGSAEVFKVTIPCHSTLL